jgi:hypothetical protein
MNIEAITNIISIAMVSGSFIYPSIKIYKMIKSGKMEKHKLPKAICYFLFYEPFLVYDVVKHFRKKGIIKQ